MNTKTGLINILGEKVGVKLVAQSSAICEAAMKKLWVSILVSILMPLTAAAQSAPPDLEITARVIPSSIPAKTEVAVTFLNTSEHPLSLPKPVLFCQKLPGGMMVVSKFKPLDSNSEQLKVAMGCAACKGISTSEPNIIEQTKAWLVLGPGESVNVQDQLSHAMIVGDAGSYRFFVIYSAPWFDAQGRQKLREAGIVLPSSGDYNSDTVTFEIQASQSNAN
jgi:hypothetical protein